MITKSGTTWGGTQSAVTNTSLALGAHTVTVGDFMVAGVYIRVSGGPPTGVSLASSLGNVVALIPGAVQTVGTTTRVEIWGGYVTIGGSETLTWSWTVAGAASSTACAWTRIGAAPDAAAQVNSASNSSITSGTSAATTQDNDLVLNFTGQSGNTAFSAQIFSPLGIPFVNPDTDFQSTGTDNNHCQWSSTLAGLAGETESFSATGGGSTWVNILLTFREMAGQRITYGFGAN